MDNLYQLLSNFINCSKSCNLLQVVYTYISQGPSGTRAALGLGRADCRLVFCIYLWILYVLDMSWIYLDRLLVHLWYICLANWCNRYPKYAKYTTASEPGRPANTNRWARPTQSICRRALRAPQYDSTRPYIKSLINNFKDNIIKMSKQIMKCD